MRLHGDRLLSYGEAAELVGRDPRTIRRWVTQGKLRAGGLGQSRWIRESDLMRALGFDAESIGSGPGHAEEDDA
ncbi:helix-turn-helix domain-containing protein [Falsiroseomonas sp.]|uniref:helix-turn-helix domain-containing protein n=1 Tax=Falsiroseomonas sp. TaxID=2870721 RepID=UPI003F6EBA3C